MNNERDPICETIRQDLAARLYGELNDAGLRRVAAHVATCSDCEQASAEMGAAFELLGAWDVPASALIAAPKVPRDERPRPLARPVARPAARAIVAGLAAAVLAFFALAALGSTLRYTEGALTLTVRTPWASSDVVARARVDEGRVRDIAAEEAARALRARSEEQQHRLRQWSAAEHAGRVELARAVDRALAEDRRVVASWLEAFSAGQARVDRHTQDALVELASYVVHDPNQ